MFEENLASLIFPKVKEFLFRLSRSAPLEVAAKALSFKNGHPLKWRDYSFCLVREDKELVVDDLGRPFDTLGLSQDVLSGTELILFYRVKDLESYDFAEKIRLEE